VTWRSKGETVSAARAILGLKIGTRQDVKPCPLFDWSALCKIDTNLSWRSPRVTTFKPLPPVYRVKRWHTDFAVRFSANRRAVRQDMRPLFVLNTSARNSSRPYDLDCQTRSKRGPLPGQHGEEGRIGGHRQHPRSSRPVTKAASASALSQFCIFGWQ